MNDFTGVLQAITGAAARIEAGTFSHDDFAEYQRLQRSITEGREGGTFGGAEAAALRSVYYCVKERAREALGLDTIYEG